MYLVFLTCYKEKELSVAGVHPEFFRGVADPEAVYNLCLILKIML
jgi:hypothetical protein